MNKIQILKGFAMMAGDLTKAEKDFIRTEAAAFGLKVRNPRCRQCWSDLAVEVAVMLSEQATAEQATAGGKWAVVPGVDVVFKSGGGAGIRVNADTLTDDLAERLLAAGFPSKYLKRNESEGNSEHEGE